MTRKPYHDAFKNPDGWRLPWEFNRSPFQVFSDECRGIVSASVLSSLWFYCRVSLVWNTAATKKHADRLAYICLHKGLKADKTVEIVKAWYRRHDAEPPSNLEQRIKGLAGTENVKNSNALRRLKERDKKRKQRERKRTAVPTIRDSIENT